MSIEQALKEVELLKRLKGKRTVFTILVSLLGRLGVDVLSQERLLHLEDYHSRYLKDNKNVLSVINESNKPIVDEILGLGETFGVQVCQYITDLLSADTTENYRLISKKSLYIVTYMIDKVNKVEGSVRVCYAQDMCHRIQKACDELIALKEVIMLEGSGIGEPGELKEALIELVKQRRQAKETTENQLAIDDKLLTDGKSFHSGAIFIRAVGERLVKNGVGIEYQGHLNIAAINFLLNTDNGRHYYTDKDVTELSIAIINYLKIGSIPSNPTAVIKELFGVYYKLHQHNLKQNHSWVDNIKGMFHNEKSTHN